MANYTSIQIEFRGNGSAIRADISKRLAKRGIKIEASPNDASAWWEEYLECEGVTFNDFLTHPTCNRWNAELDITDAETMDMTAIAMWTPCEELFKQMQKAYPDFDLLIRCKDESETELSMYETKRDADGRPTIVKTDVDYNHDFYIPMWVWEVCDGEPLFEWNTSKTEWLPIEDYIDDYVYDIEEHQWSRMEEWDEDQVRWDGHLKRWVVAD